MNPVEEARSAVLEPTGHRWLRNYFSDSRDALLVGGLSAEQLAQEFGTPLYVFDAATLRQRAVSVRTALGPSVQALFALKANPNVSVASILRESGTGVEVSSIGELLVAERAGFPGGATQFSGPGKAGPDFAEARRFGVSILNVESEEEYERLAQAASHDGYRPGASLRINLPRSARGPRLRMAGEAQKFGIALEEAPALVARIHSENVVSFRGFHTYSGTQCFDAEAWLDQSRLLLGFAERVERELRIPVADLNFGGGFGVPYFDSDPEFDLNAAGSGLQAALRESSRPDRRHYVELGRYLTAQAGVYLTRVLYVKTTRNRKHAILDGGLNHHAAAAGLGSLIPRPFPIVRVRQPRAAATERYSLGGPLCTPKDEFSQDLALPHLEAGDLVAVLASGAYGLTFSSVLFLGHPCPAEVMVDEGRAFVVRQRGKPEDVLRGQFMRG
jgi:diaminopimelate decarboxylase